MRAVGLYPKAFHRRPEVREEDVLAAMHGMIRYKQRESGVRIAVGFDGRNRLAELVYPYDEEEDVRRKCHKNNGNYMEPLCQPLRVPFSR